MKQTTHTQTAITQALETLRKGKWIDLTHEVHSKIPKFGSFPDVEIETPYTVKRDGFFVNKVSFVTQYGTHIDAPVHFVENKRTLEEIELKEFILPLFVINKEQEVRENPDFILTTQDIIDFEKEYGEISQDSFVAFQSGWSKRWEKEDFTHKDSNGVSHTPGWSIEALDFLINQRGICAIGHETLDTDASCDIRKNGHLLAEKFVLENNKYQIELLKNLDLLPPCGSIIIIGVPKFKGFPGFPARAFAITSS
ncbi:cyclase family protein [Helicobacter aurati]|uniref:Cyclase family protein n=1 Tax=Helicobacter aurati TaxID=137778 RepID=A0A3D8J6F9_9HELI|nr:cyclase family protein [Helicobacter aurati]RDU72860.1 cyclase family protein [Helicobacter aurati]